MQSLQNYKKIITVFLEKAVPGVPRPTTSSNEFSGINWLKLGVAC